MKLIFAKRKPRPYGNFCIESYLDTLRPYLSKELDVLDWEAPRYSNGIFARYWSVKALEDWLSQHSIEVV